MLCRRGFAHFKLNWEIGAGTREWLDGPNLRLNHFSVFSAWFEGRPFRRLIFQQSFSLFDFPFDFGKVVKVKGKSELLKDSLRPLLLDFRVVYDRPQERLDVDGPAMDYLRVAVAKPSVVVIQFENQPVFFSNYLWKFLDFRKSQKNILSDLPNLKLDDVNNISHEILVPLFCPLHCHLNLLNLVTDSLRLFLLTRKT